MQNLRDLKITIPKLRVDDYLSSYGIKLISLDVPTNNLELNKVNPPGMVGHVSNGVEIEGSQIKLTVEMSAFSKLEYMDGEDKLRYLFSHGLPMTISLLESYTPMYDFKKVGDIPSGVNQKYVRYHIDVTPVGSIQPKRSGLNGRFEIEFQFTDIPYRYLGTNEVYLQYPTRKTGVSWEYDIFNEGNVIQDSRRFPFTMGMSSVASKGFELISYDSDKYKTGNFKYNGNILTRNVTTFNGYMLDVDGVKNIKESNYGVIKILPGDNTLLLAFSNTPTPTGVIKFKEYIY